VRDCGSIQAGDTILRWRMRPQGTRGAANETGVPQVVLT
jgi:hypothetical protein